MAPQECIDWWRDGVIKGEYVGEAFRNYKHLNVTEEYIGLIVEDNPPKTQ